MGNANIMRELDSGHWAETNPAACPCRGSGWLLSDWDTHHKCPLHFQGQPHSEDDGGEDFDYEAADLANYRAAYVEFRRRSGLSPMEMIRSAALVMEGKPSPAAWVNAAELVACEIVSNELDQRALAAGYSCRLEAAWAAEAAVEAGARHRGMDPDVYASYGSPERADADAWYPNR